MLRKVTFSGADERNDPQQMRQLQDEFPFVEFGLQWANQDLERLPRFPRSAWIKDAVAAGLNLSLHVCGLPFEKYWLGYGLKALANLPIDRDFIQRFQRVQLNSHGIPAHPSGRLGVSASWFDAFRRTSWAPEVILQWDGCSENWAIQSDIARTPCIHWSWLQDVSHGAGRSPERWSDLPHDYVGFAGGLGVRNIRDALDQFSDMRGDRPYWVDMETWVCGPAGLNLSACRDVCALALPYIEKT